MGREQVMRIFFRKPIAKTHHGMKQPTEGLSRWLRVELHGLFHGHVSTSFSQLLLTLEFTIPRRYLKLPLIKSRHGLNHSLLSCYQNQADYWQLLRSTLQGGRISGPQVHDARVATICQQHGVSELWTADRDFGRFPGVTVRNPLIS